MASTPSYFPEIKSQWGAQLHKLQSVNEAVSIRIAHLEDAIGGNPSVEPQLIQAQLDQLQAAQNYNTFLESGSHLARAAQDAEARLRNPNLTLLERNQLEISRDQLYELSAEFNSFKADQQLRVMHVAPVDSGGKTYSIDGQVTWNNTATGLAGQAIDGFKAMASGVLDALLEGPFTQEQNYEICRSAIAALTGEIAGKFLPAPGGRPGDFLYGEALSSAANLADPAGELCRLVYPRGQTPEDVWRLGQVIEVQDSLAGDVTMVLVNPAQMAQAALLGAMGDAQVQALWGSEEAGKVLQALTGESLTPFLDSEADLSSVSALAPLWGNAQWSVLLAHAGGLVGDGVTGFRMDDGSSGHSIYSLADGQRKAVQGADGSGLLLDLDGDYLHFGAGASVDVDGLKVRVHDDGRTTIRHWLTGSVFETSSYAQSPGIPSAHTLQFDNVSYNLLDFNQRLDAEYGLYGLKYNAPSTGFDSYWNSFTQQTVDYSLASGGSGGYGLVLPQDGGFWDTTPVGAFYDSQSSAFDNAPSTATHTPRAIAIWPDLRGISGMSAQEMDARDVNGDGQLSLSESFGVYLWSDVNENGVLEPGEAAPVSRILDSSDVGLHTQGTRDVTWTRLPAPAQSTPAAPGGPTHVAPPASNYRALRNGEEIFPMNTGFFFWAPHQIKLTWSANTYQNMVGTDGNDAFDGNYFASAPNYISRFIDRVQNFYAGDGNDLMGGSARPDNLWGGTGNDTLYGYAGNDRVYGEEGDDMLFGHEGDDWLDGGVGHDALLGGAGQDSLWGGAGDDELLGGEGDDRLRERASWTEIAASLN